MNVSYQVDCWWLCNVLLRNVTVRVCIWQMLYPQWLAVHSVCVFSGNQTHNLCTANATELQNFCYKKSVINLDLSTKSWYVELQIKNPRPLKSHSCITPTEFLTVTCFNCDFLLKYSFSHKPWFQYDESSGTPDGEPISGFCVILVQVIEQLPARLPGEMSHKELVFLSVYSTSFNELLKSSRLK